MSNSEDNKRQTNKGFNYNLQVKSNHYEPQRYISIGRWTTHSRVIIEVLKLKPDSVLEIGPGNGILAAILKNMGFEVKTLDFDKKLDPDYVMDISSDSSMKVLGKFDLIIASQVLEHIKYNDFLRVMNNLNKITNNIIITLPDTNRRSKLFFSITSKFYFVKKLRYYKKVEHIFDGQHFWEIGKKNFSLRRIKKDIEDCNWEIRKTYLNYENPYHRFFLLVNKETI